MAGANYLSDEAIIHQRTINRTVEMMPLAYGPKRGRVASPHVEMAIADEEVAPMSAGSFTLMIGPLPLKPGFVKRPAVNMCEDPIEAGAVVKLEYAIASGTNGLRVATPCSVAATDPVDPPDPIDSECRCRTLAYLEQLTELTGHSDAVFALGTSMKQEMAALKSVCGCVQTVTACGCEIPAALTWKIDGPVIPDARILTSFGDGGVFEVDFRDVPSMTLRHNQQGWFGDMDFADRVQYVRKAWLWPNNPAGSGPNPFDQHTLKINMVCVESDNTKPFRWGVNASLESRIAGNSTIVHSIAITNFDSIITAAGPCEHKTVPYPYSSVWNVDRISGTQNVEFPFVFQVVGP